jgi:hypothetical protein
MTPTDEIKELQIEIEHLRMIFDTIISMCYAAKEGINALDIARRLPAHKEG